jgi:hypothetical protein
MNTTTDTFIPARARDYVADLFEVAALDCPRRRPGIVEDTLLLAEWEARNDAYLTRVVARMLKRCRSLPNDGDPRLYARFAETLRGQAATIL